MKLSPIALAASLAVMTAGAAQAAPFTPLPTSGGFDRAQIVEVAGGCGFGEHRGPYGGCRINNGPRGAMRAAVSGLPRGCPPGMHRGPYGHCHY